MKKTVAVKMSVSRSWQCRLCTLFLLVMSASASAAELTVRIFERGGKAPLDGVAVCLGTSARLTQFGAQLTNPEGYAVFPGVPRVPLLLTVSRPGYMGEQERISSSGKDRLLVMSLPTGGGGVLCPMEQGAAGIRPDALAVKSFMLNDGAAVTKDPLVTLSNQITGVATQYRVSERPDFRGAQWLAYVSRPRFLLSSGQGKKVVYFQLRRHALINGAGIETRSSIMQDSINLQF